MRDFASQGLPIQHPLLRKLWLVAKIQGHKNPFSPELLRLNVAQIDFVLEMAALDEPDKYHFQRAGRAPAPKPETTAAWFDALKGDARRKSGLGRALEAASSRLASWKANAMPQRRQGFSRGGKPLPDGES